MDNLQLMDKDKIFNLFEGDVKKETKPEKTIIPSPTLKIGMFAKLVLNHEAFHVKLDKFLKKEEPAYDVESTKESSEFVVYNRAWFYLEQINVDKKEDIFAILDFNPKTLNRALEMALVYFENGEEYLKCAHIFKIQQILKERK